MFTIYSYLVSPCTCDYKTFVSSSGRPCFACNLPPSSCYMCFLVSALNRSVDINWRLDRSKDLFLITWKVPFILPETSSFMFWHPVTSDLRENLQKILSLLLYLSEGHLILSPTMPVQFICQLLRSFSFGLGISNLTMRSSHKFYPGGVKFQIWRVFDAYKDICVATSQDCICLFCPHPDLAKNVSVI